MPDLVEGPGFPAASLMDLAATEINSVQDRAESKDYVDAAALLDHGVALAEMLGAAVAVYGPAFNPLPSLKALSYFADGDLPQLPQPVRSRLLAAVRRVDIARLLIVEAVSSEIAPAGD